MERFYSFGEWLRVGHGSELQFFALDEELDQWLLQGLPKEFWPYELLTSDMVKHTSRHYAERLVKCDSFSVAQCREGTERTSFWIASRRLSPRLLEVLRDPRDCAVNGLILVQQLQRKGARDIGRIAIANKIQNSASREVIDHSEYMKAFRALAKRARADLKYATLIGDSDNAIEDKTVALMTTAAAEAARQGRLAFSRRPGSALD